MSCAQRSGITILSLLTVLIGIGSGTASRTQESHFQSRARYSKEGNEELLARIWNGVHEAQTRHKSGCGRITEVRTSSLLARPLVFHGKFCASGTEKFNLEYFEPERIRLIFNGDYLNVTTGNEKRTTEVLRIGSNVRRTQRYFSSKNSAKNLEDNFVISIKESAAAYVMRLVPRSQRFRQRVNYVTVTLRKGDFLLSSLEIDGKNGVNSVFTIEIESLDRNVGESPYEIYKP